MENIECCVPGADFDCPYYDCETGFCELGNPYGECDDYYAYVGDEEE